MWRGNILNPGAWYFLKLHIYHLIYTQWLSATVNGRAWRNVHTFSQWKMSFFWLFDWRGCLLGRQLESILNTFGYAACFCRLEAIISWINFKVVQEVLIVQASLCAQQRSWHRRLQHTALYTSAVLAEDQQHVWWFCSVVKQTLGTHRFWDGK